MFPSWSNLIYGYCAIEKKTVNRYNYFIGFHFHEQVNLSISHGKFWMEILNSNKTNNSCAKWKSKRIYNNCSSISNSNTVSSVIGETDKQMLLMDRYQYALFTKYNSTNTSCNYIGKISYMKCECRNFSFDPKLYVYLFPFFSKAEIRMTPFSEAKSDITDFEMTLSPNESLIITKSNISNVFINYLSKSNLCQRCSVNGLFQLDQSSFKRKCKKGWKMNPGIIEFQIPKLDVNWLSYSNNLTH